MPELSPKQVAVWLLIAFVILFVGARSLKAEQATRIDPGDLVTTSGDSRPDSGGGLAFEDGDPGADGVVASTTTPGQESAVYVHVAGQVHRPGLYRVAAESRVGDALRRAGGATRRADLDQVNLAQTVTDGQQVLVPRRGSGITIAAPQGAASTRSTSVEPAPISLASATSADLETIDGIGPVTAGKILDYRDTEGPIESVEQLDAVAGIGPATMQTLREALVP